jgi:DNA-binding NarL/FixJ family response regulator
MERSTIRFIVVEDFAPFRQFICETLAKWPHLQIICEVSDGAEAVQKATELKPDLILLDIGLPTLNGIEAARQIRHLAPESKIIFLTAESSPEIVQEAFNFTTDSPRACVRLCWHPRPGGILLKAAISPACLP